MAISKTNGSTTTTSSKKKVEGYFNLDWEFKLKGEKVTKRIGGIQHWAKDPALTHLFDLLEANPDQSITIKLSANRSAVEIDTSTIEV